MLLQIEQVTSWYGKNEALKQVSLSISKGSCYGLVGPNGAGKSTLLKILASIILDYQGKIQIANQPNGSQKEQIGYVPQEICLEQNLSALSNLYFFGRLYGLRGQELRKRAAEVLEEIGLSERGKDKVMKYSGGMKRRLNIGCALMHGPKLIIMDEPTVGIDPQSRSYIFQMIARLKKKGCTIIYATHYMEEIEKLCDGVAFIDQGQIIEHGAVNELLQKHAIPSVFVKGNQALPEELDRFGKVTNHHGGYLITTNTPIPVMEAVLHRYQDEPEELIQLEIVRPRLEDVFFSLTGNELRDDKKALQEQAMGGKW